jgi:membrane protease YdiL (CAAX protease family)
MILNSDTPQNVIRYHRLIGRMILSLLLVLRIPYTIAIIHWLPIENQTGAAIYELGSYSLIVFLIWWEREQLAQFHFDLLPLSCFLILRPIHTVILNYWNVDSPLKFPRLPALFILFLAAGLALSLLKSGYKLTPLTRRNVIWLAIGLGVGLSFSVFQNPREFLSALYNPAINSSALFKSTVLTILYHLGFAPINEEPLFRGFLWGYLRQQNWRESWIWLFQTSLFMIAHIYRMNQDPLFFWIYIPLAGLLLGWLTWRSRSLAPAMLAHGLINGSAYLLLATVLH